jgi:hypothetical protein
MRSCPVRCVHALSPGRSALEFFRVSRTGRSPNWPGRSHRFDQRNSSRTFEKMVRPEPLTSSRWRDCVSTDWWLSGSPPLNSGGSGFGYTHLKYHTMKTDLNSVSKRFCAAGFLAAVFYESFPRAPIWVGECSVPAIVAGLVFMLLHEITSRQEKERAHRNSGLRRSSG